MSAPAYDRIGLSYSEVRRADPRFEATIRRALGDAKRVLNIGAGAGSYEPSDREVIAVEPSPVMIAQRRAGAAPAIQGTAESLPLEDKSVDATMGVFTMQHWDDADRGLAEVLRVTRERIVFLTLDLDVTAETWLCHDYLPESGEWDRRYGQLRTQAALDVGVRLVQGPPSLRRASDHDVAHRDFNPGRRRRAASAGRSPRWRPLCAAAARRTRCGRSR